MFEAQYSEDFYRSIEAGSRMSAKRILPIVFDKLGPSSVIDVGCGVGTWLAVAKELGATTVVGYEGEWVKKSQTPRLLDVRVADLEQPLRTSEKFDLAICMEVAEHISATRGPGLIEDLCALSPSVLFSAAIPGQGGTNHINERWQSYWAGLFQKQGYQPLDIVRASVWADDSVEYCYRQNCLLYTKGTDDVAPVMLDVIHPMRFRYVSLRSAMYDTSSALSRLPRAFFQALKRRL